MPVLLIVSQPSKNEQYWVSVKDYFDELAHQSTSTVRFHKTSNRFSEASYGDLVRIGRDESAGLYLGPVPKKENLISNLLPLTSFPRRIWVGESRFKRLEQIWPILRNASRRVSDDWILRGGSVISFQNLQGYPWTGICDLGTCEDFDVEEWSDSDDPDRQRQFVELLKRALSEQLYPAVRYRREWDCYLFACDVENAPLQIQYQSMVRKSSKTVVQDYDSTNADGERFVWLRHLAFRPRFKRFGGQWYLEITPTYVFTWDGRRLYRFHEEWLSRIKQIEKNRAVLSALALWRTISGTNRPTCSATRSCVSVDCCPSNCPWVSTTTGGATRDRRTGRREPRRIRTPTICSPSWLKRGRIESPAYRGAAARVRHGVRTSMYVSGSPSMAPSTCPTRRRQPTSGSACWAALGT